MPKWLIINRLAFFFFICIHTDMLNESATAECLGP